jgi:polysaccharide biosynthesis transport protein
MTFAQFLSVLRARWWIVLLVLVLTVVVTMAVSLILPKQYTATASVVVDVKPDPVSAVVFGGQPPPALMATQVDIINSNRVAQRVVRNLKLNENPAIRQQWQDDTDGAGTIEQWLTILFAKQLDVQPSRDSSVITISYKAPDPRFAAGLANAFTQAYIQTVLELRVDPARQYSTFFDAQAKDARDALEKAQGRLSDYQRSNGIIASDERLDVESARLNELNSQLVALQAIASESRSRNALAAGAQGDRMQEVLSNSVVSLLKSDISRGEARLQELSTRYGDNHPQVKEVKANVAELRSRLEAETRKVTGGVGLTDTINRQREAQLRGELEAQRAKVLRMKAVRDTGAVLERDVENAQKTYDVVLARLTQTNMESRATQSNVNLLTQAEPPVEPSSPKLLLNGALSVVLGALLAVGTALLLEMMDRRVRGVEDIVTTLGLPVLGVLPKAGSKGLLRRKEASSMHQRLLAPMPPASKGA